LEEPRARIIIIEDVTAGINIVRIILLAAAMRKGPRSMWRSKI
jgi:hypothetical protein